MSMNLDTVADSPACSSRKRSNQETRQTEKDAEVREPMQIHLRTDNS